MLIFFLDFLLFSSITAALLIIRNIFKSYFEQIQNYGPEIYQLAEVLGTDAAAQVPPEAIAPTLDAVNTLMQKSLWLHYLLLPLVLIIFFLLFQSLSWKYLTKTPIKRTVLALVLPLLLFGFLVINLLSYLSYIFFQDGTSSPLLLIINALLLIIVLYPSLIIIINPRLSLESSLSLSLKKLRYSLLYYLLFLLSLSLFFLLLTLSYIYLLIGLSVFPLLFFLFILLFIFNKQREHLIGKLRR